MLLAVQRIKRLLIFFMFREHIVWGACSLMSHFWYKVFLCIYEEFRNLNQNVFDQHIFGDPRASRTTIQSSDSVQIYNAKIIVQILQNHRFCNPPVYVHKGILLHVCSTFHAYRSMYLHLFFTFSPSIVYLALSVLTIGDGFKSGSHASLYEPRGQCFISTWLWKDSLVCSTVIIFMCVLHFSENLHLHLASILPTHNLVKNY